MPSERTSRKHLHCDFATHRVTHENGFGDVMLLKEGQHVLRHDRIVVFRVVWALAVVAHVLLIVIVCISNQNLVKVWHQANPIQILPARTPWSLDGLRISGIASSSSGVSRTGHG